MIFYAFFSVSGGGQTGSQVKFAVLNLWFQYLYIFVCVMYDLMFNFYNNS